MQKAKATVMQGISRQKVQRKANEQANKAEWLEERLSIMIADGGLTEFQAQQECNKLLQRRNNKQGRFGYAKISDAH